MDRNYYVAALRLDEIGGQVLSIENMNVREDEVEYKVLIGGLGLARTLRVKNLKVCRDSRLINGEFEARDGIMIKYLRLVKAPDDVV